MSDDTDSAAVRRLEQRLGHGFSDRELLAQALTHRSADAVHNERLEFLGDAVIELIITDWLFRSLPDRSEGELTRLRARIVRKESLAEHARGLDLGAALRLGGGELKSGGRHRDSILADGFEALMGALYLDAGTAVCERCLLALVEPQSGMLADRSSGKDPKTLLQEWLQGRGLPLPDYEVLRTEGAEHQRRFVVACRVSGLEMAVQGEGSSRKRAEQDAAMQALGRMRGEHD